MTLVPKLAGVINAVKGVFAAFNAVCAANPYGYQVKLVSDTSYGSLWEVSFTLKEF